MPKKAKPSSRDCIAAIKATAREGEISDETARKILADMRARAERRAVARNMKREDAARDIAGEWVIWQKTTAALQQRNQAMGFKRRGEFMDYARTKGVWGDGAVRYLENAWAAWKGLEGKYMERLYSNLKSQGVWDDFAKGRHSKDIFSEMWALSRGQQAGLTGNEKAAKIATVYFGLKRELNALKNRHGAYIREAPGHIVIQTHDAQVLRRLGSAGWGKQDMDVAYQKWRLMVDSLKIDWERTLDGPEDRDKFLRSLFQNVYTRVFGTENEVDVDQFRQQGSLASRISSGRVLWFADADSAWKYNEAFGIKAFNEAVISDIHQSTRNAALMRHLGPNPRGTMDSGISMLLKEAEELPDSAKQTDALKSSKIQWAFDKLTGLADMVERPSVARWVDWVKQWTVLSKGGAIFWSSISDKAFGEHVMKYHGIRAMHRFAAQFEALKPLTNEADRKALNGVDFWVQSLIGANSTRWTEDVRPSKALGRGLHWMFSVTGFNWHMRKHRFAYAQAAARDLADDAGLAMNKLSPERQRYFRQHGISEAEWDIWRSKVTTVKDMDGDSHPLLSPDLVEKVSESELNMIARSQGMVESAANRARVKDEMEMKLRAYFSDFVHEAVPEPGLREGALRAAPGPRGTFWREVAELAMVFKGFPLTVAMKLMARERLRLDGGGAKQWWSFADKGKWQVALLVAEAAALGYVSMTVKDMLRGKTPKRLLDDDGNINWSVWVAAMVRGGGLGIYGDFLFSEYDSRLRDFTSAAVGPVFSQLDPLADIITSARKSATEPEGPTAESVLYKLERFAEDNVPMMNIWFIKPVLDMMIFYSMREALSPGVLRRMEGSLERQGYQEYFIDPTEIQSLEPEDRLPYAVEQIVE